jgi:hypothetical protein
MITNSSYHFTGMIGKSVRYRESDIRRETMKLLLSVPGQTLTTSQLIARLTKKLSPNGKDADILEGRSDTYFSQKVRNIVSHRNEPSGLQGCGYADFDEARHSWTLTPIGRSRAATF